MAQKAKQNKFDRVLGKRPREQCEGLFELQDTPGQVFIQTTSLASARSGVVSDLENPESKNAKKQKLGVSTRNAESFN